MSALARQLQARNHEVVFLYSPSANGLRCIQGEKRDDMNANRPEISKLEGMSALEFYCGLNPMAALARKLQGRNHEVGFFYSSSANGLPCVLVAIEIP